MVAVDNGIERRVGVEAVHERVVAPEIHVAVVLETFVYVWCYEVDVLAQVG
jgi:hypothetical protein